MNKLKLAMLVTGVAHIISCGASASTDPSRAVVDSAALINAANEEIQISKGSANPQTACSLFMNRVLNRAGFPVGGFVANDFDQSMLKHLPNWEVAQFSTDNAGADQVTLRNFLNSAPDHTAFLAQWPRVGESGHVALIEKVATDQYVIYQAQLGLSPPYSSQTKIASLLYPKGKWGDRSHMRLFFE